MTPQQDRKSTASTSQQRHRNTNTATQETATVLSAWISHWNELEMCGLCAQNQCKVVSMPHNANTSTATQDGGLSVPFTGDVMLAKTQEDLAMEL